MKHSIHTSFLLFFVIGGLLAGSFVYASDEGPGISPEESLKKLQEGNRRFSSFGMEFPHLNQERLQEIQSGQHPFATILTCSDSRVTPEFIFDAGLGDLFIVRVAGNVCDTDEIGSIEYGVDHLRTPVLVVLGHTRCGAVTAVVEDAEVHGSIPELVDNIVPAVEKAKQDHPHAEGQDLIPLVIQENVWQSIRDLFARSAATRERVQCGDLMVVGAIYDLSTGKVEWLGRHPQEEELVQPSKPGFIHTVYFWINPDATPDQVKQLIADCKTLLGAVETVRKIEVGTPAGTQREVVDNSWGVSITVYFDDKEGQDFYQTAEKHLEFIERNKNTWSRVQVYDTIINH